MARCARLERKAWWIAAFLALVWGVVFLMIMAACNPVPSVLQGMIETLNGATWPGNADTLHREHRVWFSALVASRTMLNVSVPVATVAGLAWFFFYGWRQMVRMSIVEHVRLHEARLVNAMLSTLRELRPDVELTDAEIQAFHDKADEVFSELEPDLAEQPAAK